jgi:hypothetical protein
MSASAIAYTYRYPFTSELAATPAGPNLRLATCSGADQHPYFFKGRFVYPKQAADLLRSLARVVQSRFYMPPAMLAKILALADPVVTSGDNALRFEAFSACCSAYARVDFSDAALDGELHERGTTNVDFNPPLRAALAQVRDSDRVGVSVGTDRLEFSRGDNAIVERKVKLPTRWLKGFVEVQSYQSRMQRRLEISGVEARRLLNALPRSRTAASCWLVPAGRGVRLSQRRAIGAVPVAGIERLRVVEDLALHARSLCVYVDEATEACTWEWNLDGARFHLVLSPDVSRGFSGEGHALAALADDQWREILSRVRASLKWHSAIDADALAGTLETRAEVVRMALAALGARGLVGYDLARGAYFHRELPFDLEKVEKLQPRLKDARELVAEGKVRILTRNADGVEARVRGKNVEHRVTGKGEAWKCTCRWYAKHQGSRGPCKHVLAVQLHSGETSPGRILGGTP